MNFLDARLTFRGSSGGRRNVTAGRSVAGYGLRRVTVATISLEVEYKTAGAFVSASSFALSDSTVESTAKKPTITILKS